MQKIIKTLAEKTQRGPNAAFEPCFKIAQLAQAILFRFGPIKVLWGFRSFQANAIF